MENKPHPLFHHFVECVHMWVRTIMWIQQPHLQYRPCALLNSMPLNLLFQRLSPCWLGSEVKRAKMRATWCRMKVVKGLKVIRFKVSTLRWPYPIVHKWAMFHYHKMHSGRNGEGKTKPKLNPSSTLGLIS